MVSVRFWVFVYELREFQKIIALSRHSRRCRLARRVSALLHRVDPPNRISPSSDGADATSSLAPSTSSSRTLFTPPFISTSAEDVGVDTTLGADGAASRLFAFVGTLGQAAAIGFATVFPFPLKDLEICGNWAMILGVAACGIRVETVGAGGSGGIDIAAPGAGD